MNTPTHSAMALAILGRKDHPKRTAWIIWGSLLPDLIMLPLFLFEFLRGVPVQTIFDEKYFTPAWQIPIDLFNSVPLFGILALIAYVTKRQGLLYLSLAALIHIAFDFPLHNDDAHAHFRPITDWKFISPVSYWDSRHYGNWVMPVEMLILVVCGLFSTRVLVHKWAKIIWIIYLGAMPAMLVIYLIARALGMAG